MKKNTIAYIGALLIVAGLSTVMLSSCKKEDIASSATPTLNKSVTQTSNSIIDDYTGPNPLPSAQGTVQITRCHYDAKTGEYLGSYVLCSASKEKCQATCAIVVDDPNPEVPVLKVGPDPRIPGAILTTSTYADGRVDSTSIY